MRRAGRVGRTVTLRLRFDDLTRSAEQPAGAPDDGLGLQEVWGYDYAGETRTVDVHVHWLRSAVEADPSKPRYLQTVRGVGYRFTPEGDET